MGTKEFETAWEDEGMQTFAIRHLNMKRNAAAQIVKNKMFGPITNRKGHAQELLNSGLGMKPFKATYDEISEWVAEAKKFIPR